MMKKIKLLTTLILGSAISCNESMMEPELWLNILRHQQDIRFFDEDLDLISTNYFDGLGEDLDVICKIIRLYKNNKKHDYHLMTYQRILKQVLDDYAIASIRSGRFQYFVELLEKNQNHLDNDDATDVMRFLKIWHGSDKDKVHALMKLAQDRRNNEYAIYCLTHFVIIGKDNSDEIFKTISELSLNACPLDCIREIVMSDCPFSQKAFDILAYGVVPKLQTLAKIVIAGGSFAQKAFDIIKEKDGFWALTEILMSDCPFAQDAFNTLVKKNVSDRLTGISSSTSRFAEQAKLALGKMEVPPNED